MYLTPSLDRKCCHYNSETTDFFDYRGFVSNMIPVSHKSTDVQLPKKIRGQIQSFVDNKCATRLKVMIKRHLSIDY